MAFPFAELCTLFSRLEDIELKDPPLLHDAKSQALRSTTESWFKSHRGSLNALTVPGGAALLSALLPERRTDRVYGIQANGLCRMLCRSLHLQAHRARDLRAYTQAGRGDLGACLERVLQTGGPPALPIVTVEELDEVCVLLAGCCIFSDPSVAQLPAGSSEMRDNALANLVKRMEPCQAKWFVRLILKDLSPVKIDETLVLKCFHFLLPDLLRFQQNFDAALELLKGPLKEYHERPDPRSERLLRAGAATLIEPCVGVKVGRPTFHKARSIEHCLRMLDKRKWVLERKYDGEYCEVHIDLALSNDPAKCIKIFSKSGKDSTHDRRGIHKTLVRCLRLGQPDCKIKRQAIILGELVVWSDQEKEPLPFEKIRKHVTRSGVCIGTETDSQRKPDEHLAIVFFDLLLLDTEVVMTKPVEERRQWLREIYTKVEGRAMSSEWRIANFADAEKSRKALLDQFAMANARRCEGLVLKPCGLPYFTLHADVDGFRHGFIKLKKDYLSQMGDEADLAVVGASYNAQQALKSGLKNIKWTDFHLGAMTNKDDVERFGARPKFRVVGTIQQAMCIPRPILQTANVLGALSENPHAPGAQAAKFDFDGLTAVKMDHVFDSPLVFEVLGSGFEKPSNSSHFMLRHARVKKLHQDRTWKDCTSFQELQEQAHASRNLTTETESQETRAWLVKLERKCRKKFERERTATPKSDATKTPRTAIAPASEKICTVNVALTKGFEAPTHKRVPLQGMESNSVHSRTTREQVSSGDMSAPHGTTLIQEQPRSGVKRGRDDTGLTPYPEPKRTHTLASKAASRVPETPTAVPTSSIVRQAPRDVRGTGIASSTPFVAARLKGVSRTMLDFLQPACPTSSSRSQDSNAATKLCEMRNCLFSGTVVYIAPCISHAPYITADLLPSHNSLPIPSLAYWDRDSHAHAPMATVVSESQSFPDRRKVVLVESKREQAMKAVVDELVVLNKGKFRERVELWDWRVLELLQQHAGDGAEVRRWFVGATIWEEGKGRTAFVWNEAR